MFLEESYYLLILGGDFIRKFLKSLEILFLILVVFLFVFVVISKFYLKKDLIKLFGNGFLIVVTGSMEPTIHMEELIVIREMKNYKVNDIVTYKNKENNYVTHRIIEIHEDEIITRGDNNTINDEPINITNIEGKVVFHSIVLGEIFLYWLKPILYLMISISMFNFIRCSLETVEVKNEKGS